MTKASRFVASPRVVCIEDFRPLACERVPKAVFDYLDGGAEGEVTLRENCRVFEDVTFRPRNAVVVPECSLRTRILGFELSLPFMLAPVGYSRLMHPGGELAAARAAGLAGTAYILSTISGHRLEDVKAASAAPVFYQLYLMGGRQAAEAAIERARHAGFSALVVTIDTPVSGIRERDYRNGMSELISGGLLQKIPFLPQLLARPAWLTAFLLDGGLHRNGHRFRHDLVPHLNCPHLRHVLGDELNPREDQPFAVDLGDGEGRGNAARFDFGRRGRRVRDRQHRGEQ